jgi:hypothetical protein
MNAVNLTARANWGFPLADPALCRRVWAALRRNWPRPLAACLMGNHLHLLVPGEAPPQERELLARVLGHVPGWPASTCSATLSAGRVKIRRDIRYVVLNPCRAGLARDPLEWLWSTHRDVVGAAHDPWADRASVARLEGGRDPIEAHHRYVSADPHVDVRGTPAPRPVRLHEISAWPLRAVMDAAVAATLGGRIDKPGPARIIFLQLAKHQGWTKARQLAELSRVERSAVYRAWRRPDLTGPALLCLGDTRLRAMRVPS